MIKGKDLSLSIKGKKILHSLNFEIAKNKITLFLGKSGSGKTTLLKTIAGLYKPCVGKIFHGYRKSVV